MSDICVLGTGMAGFGAAYRLREAGRTATLFDKHDHYGGHTASYRFDSRCACVPVPPPGGPINRSRTLIGRCSV